MPRHIAIIMDGNGRWASERGLLRIQGHREGARNVRRLSIHCSSIGVQVLTLYAFSVENWIRPSREIQMLMRLLKIFAVRERPIFMENNVRLETIGDLARLPEWARESLEETKELTKKNTGMVLQLALSYSGRDEMVRATKKIAEKVKNGQINPAEITEDIFSAHLDTAQFPDPDLVIRTSGELRMSNYLLWQSAYSEFYFTDKYWPDFREPELQKALQSFSKRERRYGGVQKKIS